MKLDPKKLAKLSVAELVKLRCIYANKLSFAEYEFSVVDHAHSEAQKREYQSDAE
jgi:hypothetical protein